MLKTNLGLVGNIDLVSGSDWRMWKLESSICLTLVSLGWNRVIRAGGLGDQLSDCNTYKRTTTTDLTYTHKQRISDFITANGPREGISEMFIKYLILDSPRTPTFYRRSTNQVTQADPL